MKKIKTWLIPYNNTLYQYEMNYDNNIGRNFLIIVSDLQATHRSNVACIINKTYNFAYSPPLDMKYNILMEILNMNSNILFLSKRML